MKNLLLIAAVLIAAVSAPAQTITSTGLGIAGNGKAATTQPYNIDIVSLAQFDGDRNPLIYIAINGKLYPVFAPSAYSSAYCRVLQMVSGHPVNYGFIKAKTPDGTQFLAGTIFIQTVPIMKVISFKGMAFYTPQTMPFLSTGNQILVYQYQPSTNTFVLNPNWTIHTPLVGGAMWVNQAGDRIYSAVLDGFGVVSITPVPPPGGIGGNIPPIMPAKMF